MAYSLALLAAAALELMVLAAPHRDDRGESLESRRARLAPRAAVYAEASRGDVPTLAFLLAVAEKESHWATYVLEGRCLDGRDGEQCDKSSRTGLPQARTEFQVWGWCKEAWKHPDGTLEALRGAAECAARLSRGARQTSRIEGRPEWKCAFTAYYKLRAACDWPGADSRALLRARREAELWRILSRKAA